MYFEKIRKVNTLSLRDTPLQEGKHPCTPLQEGNSTSQKGWQAKPDGVVCHRPMGITLIELIMVIFIISITTAFIMPSFWSSKEDKVKREAKDLSATLRYVYDEAINRKMTYIFRFDLDKNTYGFDTDKVSRRYQIRLNEGLKDVIIPSLGTISRGEVTVEFGPLGPIEPIIAHLKEDEIEYTISLNHITGRTRVYEGYRL